MKVCIFVICCCSVEIEVIRGLAVLKKATALVNMEFGLDEKLADVIEKAADEVFHSADVCLSLICLWILIH